MSEIASDNSSTQEVLEELSNASAPPTPHLCSSNDDDEKKLCWVCLNSDDDDDDEGEEENNGNCNAASPASWAQPCMCKGTAKWVHRTCLNRWVDEKRKNNINKKVYCPQCNTEYLIVFPKMGVMVQMLDTVDLLVHTTSPLVAGLMLGGALYWSAVTHGALTVVTVMGCDSGLGLMETKSPYILLLALPVIPTALVLSKMVCWEDRLWLFLRNNCAKFPFMRQILPSFVLPEQTRYSVELPPLFSYVCTTRLICSALLMPSISALVGRLFFESIENNWQRTLLGGITFVAVKGVLKIYLKQQRFVRLCQQQILDYTDHNIVLSRKQAQRFSTANSSPALETPVTSQPSSSSNNSSISSTNSQRSV